MFLYFNKNMEKDAEYRLFHYKSTTWRLELGKKLKKMHYILY